MRRAVAESHFELGKPETADKLYREWLAADPQWGFGWVGWSDFYWLMGRKDQKDAGKAEAIFREGLSVEAVRDRDILLERFAEFCTEAGRAEEAAAARRELDALKAALKAKAAAKSRRTSTLVPPVAPAVARRGDVYPSAPAKEPPDVLRADPKPGRNDPCPCGSGKKYKKCCGRE
jgi:predicted Zn-dependent protease